MDPFVTLFDLVGVLARRRYQAAEKSFAALGLNHSEARLLSILHHEGGRATQDTLSAGLHIDRTNAGRALKRLESEGFIERCPNDLDKRSKRVHMTAKGQGIIGEIATLKDAMAHALFDGLSESEAKAAVKILNTALNESERERCAEAQKT